jgi:hypothetical protein
MNVTIVLEPVAGNGYRARGGEPFALTAEGATREEAVRNLQRLIQERLSAGWELVSLEVPARDNPWVTHAGMFKDDLLFREVQDIMAEQRRQADADPDSP